VDPFQAAGWKLFHGLGTFMVAVPTLITGFTVIASLEIAGRLRGGQGLFGWIRTLPWDNPIVLAAIFAMLMLTLGGFGGVVNASYAMNTVVHNTMWVPAHFHLIFAGTTVIMYFGITYVIWPKLTGQQLYSRGLANAQLWLWFVGMAVLTLPWHWVGITGMPRRTAWMPYEAEYIDQWDPYLFLMAIGGTLAATSALLFLYNLVMTSLRKEPEPHREMEWAEPVRPVLSLPKPLNGFALWNWILVVYMTVSFGYPIAQFFILDTHNALRWGW
jgi:cytochrome c oxidase subunit 1